MPSGSTTFSAAVAPITIKHLGSQSHLPTLSMFAMILSIVCGLPKTDAAVERGIVIASVTRVGRLKVYWLRNYLHNKTQFVSTVL